MLLMMGTAKKQPTQPLQGKVTVSIVNKRKRPEVPAEVQTEKDWTRRAEEVGTWEERVETRTRE